MDECDESGNIIPESETVADKAFFLANVQCVAFCYLLGGAAITNFKFVDRTNLNLVSEEIKDLWNSTLSLVRLFAPYDFRGPYETGEQTFLVSISFPCWDGWNYQYRTSRQTITVTDVVDLMFEIMDVKPREKRYVGKDGRRYFQFSWMFLASDIERLLAMFPGEPYKPSWSLPMHETFHDMDRKLNLLARQAVDVYPFMECEFYGW